MAENNVTWKGGAGFSEECTKLINSYFKTFEPIVLLSRGSGPEPRNWAAYGHGVTEFIDKGKESDLINAIILDVFNIPGILPHLHDLRDKLDDLHYRLEVVLCVDTGSSGSCLPDLAEKYFSSVERILDAVEAEIKDLEGRQAMKEAMAEAKKRSQENAENKLDEFLSQFQELEDDEKTAEVTSPPSPVKVPEKPAVEAGMQRESFRFDVTIGVKNEFEKMFNFLQGYLDCDNDMEAAKTALKSCLFGTPDNRYKIKINSRGQAAIASFFGEMAFQAGHDRRATLEFTILKWFVKHDGTSLSSKYVQNNTRTNSTARSFVQELFQKKKENVYGVTEKG